MTSQSAAYRRCGKSGFMLFGGFPAAKHTRGNALGVKAARPNIRVLKRADFQELASIPALVERFFGNVGQLADKSL